MPRLLIHIILCTLLFTYTTYSGILRKYKDGISIDSLVENWRPTDYKTVKTLLEKERIDFVETFGGGCDWTIGIFRERVFTIKKVFYKGYHLGGGTLTFRGDVNDIGENSNSYKLICFSTSIHHNTEIVNLPKSQEVKSAFLNLLNVFLKKPYISRQMYPIDCSRDFGLETNIDTTLKEYELYNNVSAMKPESKQNGNVTKFGYQCTLKSNVNTLYVELYISNIHPIVLQIGTQCRPLLL